MRTCAEGIVPSLMSQKFAYTKLFRAVSQAELKDVCSSGIFRPEPLGRSLESKQFAVSASDAAAFGRDNAKLDGKPFFVIEVPVEKTLVELCEHLHLDGRSAVNVPGRQLQAFNAATRVDELVVVAAG